MDYNNHDCFPVLKNLTKEQKKKIAQRDAMIAALEETKNNFQRQIAEKQAQLVQRDALIA
jgi:hypothetical protein